MCHFVHMCIVPICRFITLVIEILCMMLHESEIIEEKTVALKAER